MLNPQLDVCYSPFCWCHLSPALLFLHHAIWIHFDTRINGNSLSLGQVLKGHCPKHSSSFWPPFHASWKNHLTELVNSPLYDFVIGFCGNMSRDSPLEELMIGQLLQSSVRCKIIFARIHSMWLWSLSKVKSTLALHMCLFWPYYIVGKISCWIMWTCKPASFAGDTSWPWVWSFKYYSWLKKDEHS